MPGGVKNQIIGYSVFAAIKFAGYSLAAKWLNRRFNSNKNIFIVGAARLLIGMVFGVGVWGVALGLAQVGAGGVMPFAYVLLLFPVRMLEWHLLLKWFYKHAYSAGPDYKLLALGALWSYVLDVPAVIGAIATSGLWIC